MVRQYIGARYVTKIYENSQDPSSAEWESSVNYEPLTMVTYNFGSYLSKKEVPASVGNPADNPTYWVQTGFYNGQIANLQQQIDDIKSDMSEYVTPDDFEGDSDGEKIQAAFDALESTGGTILINRAYTLDRDILVKYRTTNPHHEGITIIGVGGASQIDFASYHFEGYDTNYIDYGGLLFQNLKFKGTDKAFVTDHLIRITLLGCQIWNFDYIFYGEDFAQTTFIIGCRINQIKKYVQYVLRECWDSHFADTQFELCDGIFNAYTVNNLSVINNLIESYASETVLNRSQFVFRQHVRSITVIGNYFEDNENVIDLSEITNNIRNTVEIRDNFFIEPQRNTGAICIKLPKTAVTNTSIFLVNNSFKLNDVSQYAIAITETGHDITNVIIDNCHGDNYQIYDPEYRLHDIANYNSDTITKVLSMTDNVNAPVTFKRYEKVCNLCGIFTAGAAASSGDVIISLDDVRNGPNSTRTGVIYDTSDMTPIQCRIASNGQVDVRGSLTNGNSYMIDLTWICR